MFRSKHVNSANRLALRALVLGHALALCAPLAAQGQTTALDPRSLAKAGSQVYFSGVSGEAGRELWKTDGSAFGTGLVKDILSGAESSSPVNLKEIEGTLYFGANGTELWKSDGSAAATTLVRNLSSVFPMSWARGELQPLARLNGKLVVASTPYVPTLCCMEADLFATDGTDEGTSRLSSFTSYMRVTPFGSPMVYRGALYFAGANYISDSSLWKTDGTPGGTMKVKEVATHPAGESNMLYTLPLPAFLTQLGSSLVFGGSTPATGWELWRSDGTTAGTVVQDLVPGDRSSNASKLTNVNDTLYFAAEDGVNGVELWKSDGTTTSTMVKDISSGAAGSSPANLTDVNGMLYFTANDGTSGVELWKSDGTTAGTVRVRDIRGGADSSSPANLTNVNGTLFFTADDGVNGVELWRSDGTASGTVLVKDIAPGPGSSAPAELVNLNGLLLFSADDGATGRGLWRSDGTASGALPMSGAPALTINDVRMVEGNQGTSLATFTVYLSGAGAQAPVTVNYATTDESGPNSARAGTDYVPVKGTLTFAAGETSKSVVVSVIGNTRGEPDKALIVRLDNAQNARVSRGEGTLTVLNDDARPQPVYQPFFAVNPLETPYVGDFNGDGKSDIITFTRQNPLAVGDVYVALSDGTKFGPAAKWHDFFAIDTSEQVVIGDYDGDGKDDIGTWLGATSRQFYVALSQGTGMGPASLWLDRIGSDATDQIFAGDANGDGREDLICFSRKEGKVYVALSDSAGFPSPGMRFLPPTIWHPFFAVSTYERPRVADLNGDGKVDIVTFATDSPTAFGDVYVALSNGTAFRAADGSPNADKWHDFFAIRQTEEVRIGDLNGDRRDDFFTFLPLPWGQCYTALSSGNAMAPSVLWREDVQFWYTDKVFVGDVNGDGKSDIIIFAQSEGKVFVSLSS